MFSPMSAVSPTCVRRALLMACSTLGWLVGASATFLPASRISSPMDFLPYVSLMALSAAARSSGASFEIVRVVVERLVEVRERLALVEPLLRALELGEQVIFTARSNRCRRFWCGRLVERLAGLARCLRCGRAIRQLLGLELLALERLFGL